MTTKTTDQRVIELFNTVRAKKKEIEGYKKPSWLTSCTLSYTDNPSAQDKLNIQTITNVDKLVEIYAFLLGRKALFNQAAKELGLNTELTKYNGYSFEDWGKDIKSRVEQISVAAKKKELETLENRLDALISVEQRREMELEAITKELGA